MASQITIRSDGGRFSVEIPGQVTDGLDWTGMFGVIAALTHPAIKQSLIDVLGDAAGSDAPAERPAVRSKAPAADGRHARAIPGVPSVTISIELARARAISDGMASLLCWHRGYSAGREHLRGDDPIGVEEARSLRLLLRSAIQDATGERDRELPF